MKISVVSYLNSKPFIYGLENNPSPEWNVSLDIPSECARKLIAGEADLGLIPVAALLSLPGYRIVSPYCIGAVGKVDSVKLYSHVPVEKIERVLLDYQSRTSVNLVQVLAREWWKIAPEWIPAQTGFESHISGTTAAVVIGDRTFAINGTYPYEYDLSEGWQLLTGLPFVFAVWAARRKMEAAEEEKFSTALRYGLANIDEVVKKNAAQYPGVDVNGYLTRSISYNLDLEKRKAIELFLMKIA
jgi:chorismate dehydratase